MTGTDDRTPSFPPDAPNGTGYEHEKQLARDPDPSVRRALAAREDVRPEVLYFLAEDSDPAVRLAVARNRGTPRQADLLLSTDAELEIRTGLAEKIARLVPDMPEDRKSTLHALTLQALETLAEDQMVMVRRVLAESLKDAAGAPHGVVRLLAEDSELAVAQPILEFSPVLSDGDLIEIMNSGPVQGAMRAIARRADLSGDVSAAFVSIGGEADIAALLANPLAQIREDTLDMLADGAESRSLWHEPLVLRPRLSPRAVLRLASFVAMNLLDRLQSRIDLPPETLAEVAILVERRLEQEAGGGDRPASPKPAGDELDQQIARLAKADRLDDRAIEGALARGDRPFVIKALAYLTGLLEEAVEGAIDAQNGKAIVAMVWKADLHPRLAQQVQNQLAGIPPHDMIRARGDDWPLSTQDMNWQLNGLSGKRP